MTALLALIRRNSKLFFRDKGLFFTSLITPLILLALFAAFLCGLYRDTFQSILPQLEGKLLEGLVGAMPLSSLLSVSCVTVPFCSNMLLVQDKCTGARQDLAITGVKDSAVALGYFLSTALSSLLICLVAAAACFLYIALSGWFLSAADVLCILLDVVVLVLFGTAMSSVVNFFLTTQGQISAVGSIVSSVYGFLCGAYMPISQLSPALQKILTLLPGTYGTALLRTHALRGVLTRMESEGIPPAALDGIRSAMGCQPDFLGCSVTAGGMYAMIGGTAAALIAVYILLHAFRANKSR